MLLFSSFLSSPASARLSVLDDGRDRSGSFAIIHIMGRQRWVELGRHCDVYRIQQVPGRHVYLHRVLFFRTPEGIDMVGRPFVENVRITAVVLCHFRGKKQKIYRFKPKKRYRRMVGFRQEYTRLRIETIEVLPPFYTAEPVEDYYKQPIEKDTTKIHHSVRSYQRVKPLHSLEQTTYVPTQLLMKELTKEQLRIKLTQKYMGVDDFVGVSWGSEEEDSETEQRIIQKNTTDDEKERQHGLIEIDLDNDFTEEDREFTEDTKWNTFDDDTTHQFITKQTTSRMNYLTKKPGVRNLEQQETTIRHHATVSLENSNKNQRKISPKKHLADTSLSRVQLGGKPYDVYSTSTSLPGGGPIKFQDQIKPQQPSASSPISTTTDPSSTLGHSPFVRLSSTAYLPWPGLGGVSASGEADRKLQLLRMYRLRVNNRNCRELKNFVLGDPVYCLLRSIERERKPGQVLKFLKHRLNKRKLTPEGLKLDFQHHTPFSHFDPIVNRKVTEGLMDKLA